MRLLNAVLGFVGLAGAVCCTGVVMMTPVSFVWAGYLIGGVFQAYFAAQRAAMAITGEDDVG